MRIPLLLLLLAGGPLGCLATDTPQRGDATPFLWVDAADPAAAPYRQTGEQLISRIGNNLIFEVENSIAENGVTKSLEAMHLKKFVLPKTISGQPRVMTVKRTSLQLRNPANQPDDADRAALERINTAIRDGDVVPGVLIQRLEPANAPVEWRVYRPINTMPICLKCHGPQEELQPEVRTFLAQHYPADQATKYTSYKWRGLIRVSLAAAEAPAKK